MVVERPKRARKRVARRGGANYLAILLICALIVSVVLSVYLYYKYDTLSSKYDTESSRWLALTGNPIHEGPFRNTARKMVIIRDDDVGSRVGPAVEWLSGITVSKNIKMTYAVIPANLRDHPEVIDYLNNLDEKYFELAAHGYDHEDFEGMPYDEQYSLIEAATKIMEEGFGATALTFVSPNYSDDVNTTRVLRALGYHSISGSSSRSGPSYVVDFPADLQRENDSTTRPWGYWDYEFFRDHFDRFYYSSYDFYVFVIHHDAFYDASSQLDEALTREFERYVDYMKGKNVEFVTIEEAYQWIVDEGSIRWGKVNEDLYFIDLSTSQYDHTVRFDPPPNWQENVSVVDVSTGEKIGTYEKAFEFAGVKGHSYEVVHGASTPEGPPAVLPPTS
ncbi:MAG: DUF2334 domain-containing protein [Dehalococcoidia bacterium]